MDTRPPAPIFVVGAPRSGTTMLAAMLGSHSRYAAGPETHFFSKLPCADLKRAADDPDWPGKAIETLCELTLAGQSVADLFGASRASLYKELSGQTPTIRAMLEALTVPFARLRAKPGWVEKTPNHILHLNTIRSLWPEARIIRIVRDPRDVAISMCRLPAFSNSVMPNLYLWREWNHAAEPFLATDKQSYTIRYESLVSDPERELTELCDFLHEPFEPLMLDFGRAAGDVSSKAETWKKPVAAGLSTARIFAWRRDLPDELRPFCNLLCHEYLKRFDYEWEAAQFRTRTAYRMSREYVERHQKLLLEDARKGLRWLPATSPENADKIVDQPEYIRFRDPRLWVRLGAGRIGDAIRKARVPASPDAAPGF